MYLKQLEQVGGDEGGHVAERAIGVIFHRSYYCCAREVHLPLFYIRFESRVPIRLAFLTYQEVHQAAHFIF